MDKRRPDKYLHGVTLRAIIVALLLIPLNNYWIFLTEIVRYAGHPTTISLFYNSVFVLVLLVALNAAVRRTVPRWVFSQGELLTIYIMINIASALAGHDLIEVLIPGMTHPFKFATPENGWANLFLTRIPTWLSVRDKDVVDGFYLGAGTLYTRKILLAWALPVLMWTLFITVLLFVMLCLTVLLRKQWTEREKLTYPLVHLPLDISNESSGFFRNKLLWTGFGIAAGIDLLQGLHSMFPTIPGLPIKELNLIQYITAFPWTAIGNCPISFYPFGIGLGALLPLDLSFSAWFFFIFWKMEVVIAAALGWTQIPRFPYVNEQSFGAYMGICLFALWASRRHLADIGRHMVYGKGEMDDSSEPISYRKAGIGAILGMLLLMVFANAIGMSWWLVPCFFAIYFALSIGITRMRAELGPPAHDLHMGGPDNILPALIGPSKLGTGNMVAMSLMFWFNRAYRAHPMPFQLEGFKMAERASMHYRRLFYALMIAAVAGTLAAFWSQLHVYYQLGAASKMSPPTVPLIFGGEPYARLDTWIKGNYASTDNTLWAILAGLGFTLLLNSLRMRFLWFPFHPVGFAISSSWSMHQLWMCMFIAWFVKLILLRYGGLRLYRTAVPFFLGLVLGECIMGSLWTLIGIALNTPTYAFWP